MGDEQWLAGSGGDIRYEVGSLTEFAERMQERLAEFQSSMTTGVLPMATAAMPGSQLAESELFARAHRVMLEASQQLNQEIMIGLMILKQGATSVEAQYESGDAMAAATNNSVLDTFYPVGNENILKAPPTGENGGQPGVTGPDGEPIPTAQPTEADQSAADQHANTEDRPGGSSDGGGESSIHDGQWINQGEAGEYEIPADDEGMRDAPTGPELPD